jgi:hypothetical protein
VEYASGSASSCSASLAPAAGNPAWSSAW